MLDWWRGRSRREQGLLAFLAMLCVAVALWYGLVMPLRAYAETARASRASAEMRLQRMQAVAAARAARPAMQNLRQAMEQAARQAGVNPQLGAAAGTGIEFELVRAPRTDAMSWLVRLDEHGVEVASLSIHPHDDGTATLKGTVGP